MMATAAGATVTFNPSTGTGFVGKGDVQLAYGWNNATLQKNASGIGFVYVAQETYTAVCTWTTGEGTRGEQTHNVNHRTTTGISSTIAYDPRVRNQITGFTLTGILSTTTEVGTVPVVGGACPGNQGTDGVWTSVALTASTVELDVTYQGLNPVKIWPPAAI
jgi:hypothetical protein